MLGVPPNVKVDCSSLLRVDLVRSPNVGFRRNCVIAGRPGEGLLIEAKTVVPPGGRVRLYMPQTGP
jgi:hypothetical protein